MRNVLIVGGGAAGMMAAYFISGIKDCRVQLFERNEKLGKKLFITGKGRCNLTNACDEQEFFDSVVSNPKFLYSAFSGFSNRDVMTLFEELGLRLKTERGQRVFPASDHSSDVIKVLERELRRRGVQLRLSTRIEGLVVSEGKASGIRLAGGEVVSGDAIVLATGGLSYPVTGSDGDGHRFLRQLDIKVTDMRPSLVPFITAEDYIPRLQGLSLKNVTLVLTQKGKVVYREFGELMFTHFGITGPLVLTASAKVGKRLEKGELKGYIDLKPAIDAEVLDRRLIRELETNPRRHIRNMLGELLPAKMIDVFISLLEISPDTPCCEVSRQQRTGIRELLKAFPMTVTGTRGYEEAIITKGGVSVKEIDPKTMAIKKYTGLYCIGELLDLDALTGGFNLQIAWSTARQACAGIEQQFYPS